MNQKLRSVMAIGLAAALGLSFAGCATVKKKFTRKSTEGPARPVVYTEKEFVKPYTNEYYYTTNFNMWKVWHEELLNSIGSNAKHLERAASETVSRLEAMQGYLEEPKKSELEEQIRYVKEAAASVQQGSSTSPEGQARTTLERSLRLIKSKYYVDDVKPWLKKDEITL